MNKVVKYDGTQGSVVDIVRSGAFVGQPEEGGLELHTEKGVFPVEVGDWVCGSDVIKFWREEDEVVIERVLGVAIDFARIDCV